MYDSSIGLTKWLAPSFSYVARRFVACTTGRFLTIDCHVLETVREIFTLLKPVLQVLKLPRVRSRVSKCDNFLTLHDPGLTRFDPLEPLQENGYVNQINCGK